jgi:perosamine synthetase
MIPMCVPDLSGNESRYLQECISSTFVSSVGPFTHKFEKVVAESAGAARGVATGSGTSALHLALLVAGVRAGDLVILPSFTFIASANAISHCGAIPWLMDVDPETWCLDPLKVAEALDRETVATGGATVHRASGRRVAAILPVYTLGAMPSMRAFAELCERHDLRLVGDAACAIGAEPLDGVPVAELADLSVFSFNGNKTVTAGGGGVIVGREDLLRDARHLSTQARSSSDYVHDKVGYNYRITNLQAAVGCAQMERLDTFIAAKRRIRGTYQDAFGNLNAIKPFPTPAGSVCWLSGLVLAAQSPLSVEDLCKSLGRKGVEARPFWRPVHLQEPYADAPCEGMGVTESIWDRILTLPCSTNLSPEEQGRVIAAVKALL